MFFNCLRTIRRYSLAGGVCFMCSGCATLSKSQIEAVNQFAKSGSNFSAYPGKIMLEMAEIRYMRGLYYANSIENPVLHINELDSVYYQRMHDYQVPDKIDITFKVIDKYAQALQLLSSDKYEHDLESQAKTFGIGLDSLILLYNSTEGTKKLPSGIGGAVNALITSGGRQYIRIKQAKEIKKFVTRADTLIAVMTDNLSIFLRSSHINELIKNEDKQIRRNYLSYLQQTKTETRTYLKNDTTVAVSNTKSTIENDKAYLDLRDRIETVKTLQKQTIKANQDLRKAHKKLLEELRKKKDIKETIQELQAFNEEIKGLKAIIDKINN